MLAPKKTCHHSDWPRLAPWPTAARRAGLGVLATMLTTSALAAEAVSQPGERLGTLFYSAAERTAIIRGRHDDDLGEQSFGGSQMTVTGVVKRQGGHSTAWINGQPIHEGHSAPNATRLTMTHQGVTLDGNPVRVGETLDLSTRERSDVVAPGSVTVRAKK